MSEALTPRKGALMNKFRPDIAQRGDALTLLRSLPDGCVSVVTDNALDHRARRAVARLGLTARKSRWRKNSIDNFDGYQIIHPETNCVVEGYRRAAEMR
jgi:hypothetical protein